MDVEWSEEQMLNLIEQYELGECLWNVTSKDYKNQNKKKAAWQEVSFHIGTDVDFVEKRIKSLRDQRERRKAADAKKSGCVADDMEFLNDLLVKGSHFFMESTSQGKQENRR
jgi:hypothetical protein